MYRKIQRGMPLAVAVLILCGTAAGTTIPRLSFEELTDSSELVVSGQIARTWADWDSGHKYIWTHYELRPSAAFKGVAGQTVEFAEPGGSAAGTTMVIAGSVMYTPGDNVTVFLARMPNGYLRTSGWSQGKFMVDSAGRLHGGGVLSPGSSIRSLEGVSVQELGSRVAARVKATAAAGRNR